MDTIRPVDFALWSSGVWKSGAPAGITGVSNDSRKVASGQLFAALRTPTRDGHDFLESARVSGAAGAIVDRYQPEFDFPQLVVPEVGAALLSAARGYRDTWAAKVVGISGSCGKTTCKDLLARLLSEKATLSTLGNLNNLIGVPMSMLRPEAATCSFAVLEAGISEPGEMSRLAKAIDPDWGIITAIGPAHLKDLGSVETIAREKGMLARGSRVKQTFLGESCAAYLGELAAMNPTLVKQESELATDWSFRFESAAGRTLLEQRIDGLIQWFDYAGLGYGLASNVALALATAYSMGVEVISLREALAGWRPSQLRNEWRMVGESRVFFDCYNANPLSMHDSLETFVAHSPTEKPRLYLIGCMEELGAEASRLHEELGRGLSLRKEDFLLVIGSEAKSVLRGMKDSGREMDRCVEIGAVQEAHEYLAGFVGSVFLKGSRRYRLESALDSMGAGAEIVGGVLC